MEGGFDAQLSYPLIWRYQRRIDSSEQSVMNPPPADHVEKSIVDFSLKIMQKA